MSQRSHIAHSGSRAISECSAAWSDESSVGMSSSPSSCALGRAEPDRLRLEARRRQVERDGLEGVAARDRLALVGDHLLGHRDPAEVERQAEPRFQPQRLHDRRLGLLLRLRVPVDRRLRDERRPGLEVERSHEVLLAEVQVDGALVDRRERARALDEPEHGARRLVDDGEGLAVRRPQRHACGRIVGAGPDPARRSSASARAARPPARAPPGRGSRRRPRRSGLRRPPRGRARRAPAGSRRRGSPPRPSGRAAPRGRA